MKKKLMGLLLVMGLLLTFAAIKPASADAATVPARFRHNWYYTLSSSMKRNDPLFVKITKHSIDRGDKAYHNKISGSNLQVIKRSKGWYEMGAKGISNTRYKVTKRKINGVKRTVLLARGVRSRYATVYMLGRKHILPLGSATVRV